MVFFLFSGLEANHDFSPHAVEIFEFKAGFRFRYLAVRKLDVTF